MSQWPSHGMAPKLGVGVYIAPTASVIGQVELGDYVNIWPGAVLRADINKIMVGHHSNIQDLTVMHVESDRACVIGNYVTCGHRVILHACTVEDDVLIGMGAIILNGAVVQRGAMIGAGALITENKVVEEHALYLGVPAKRVRVLTNEEVHRHRYWADKYVELADTHRKGYFVRHEGA